MNISAEEREKWIYENAAFVEDALTEEDVKEASEEGYYEYEEN